MDDDVNERPALWKLLLLGLGIYVAPYIFVWFTLKQGYPKWYRIVSFSYAAILTSLFVVFIFLGGDRWPLTVDNRAHIAIRFTYLHKDYDHWSAPIDIGSGTATRLALFHFLKDVKGITISEGAKSYSLSSSSLEKFRRICPGETDCYITYWGGGRVQVSLEPTTGLQYENSTTSR